MHYFHMVLAGLAAKSPHMLSATILSLGRLVYEFRGELKVLAVPLIINRRIVISVVVVV